MKFRIYNKNTNKMLLNNVANTGEYLDFYMGIDGHLLIKGGNGENGGLRLLTGICIPEYVIMPSIGLKDNDGVEIYEGDIIEFSNYPEVLTETTIVENATYFLLFISMYVDEQRVKKLQSGEFEASVLIKKFKVIGNIYQNPTLIDDLRAKLQG